MFASRLEIPCWSDPINWSWAKDLIRKWTEAPFDAANLPSWIAAKNKKIFYQIIFQSNCSGSNVPKLTLADTRCCFILPSSPDLRRRDFITLSWTFDIKGVAELSIWIRVIKTIYFFTSLISDFYWIEYKGIFLIWYSKNVAKNLK